MYTTADYIKLRLLEFHGITIMPDMGAPASLNFINGKKVFYVARTIPIENDDGSLMDSKQIVERLIKAHGLVEKDESVSYRKYFAFYDIDEERKEMRYALGDYE